MKALERRIARLEARGEAALEPIRILLHVISPDGTTRETLVPDKGGGWLPATEAEIAGDGADALAAVDEVDSGL